MIIWIHSRGISLSCFNRNKRQDGTKPAALKVLSHNRLRKHPATQGEQEVFCIALTTSRLSATEK